MRAKKKFINNKVGEHCQLLLDDFFNFADGHPELVRLVVINDLTENERLTDLEKLQRMYARTDNAWKHYCDVANLPRESRNLFTNKAQAEWHRREKGSQKKLRVGERTRSAIG